MACPDGNVADVGISCVVETAGTSSGGRVSSVSVTASLSTSFEIGITYGRAGITAGSLTSSSNGNSGLLQDRFRR